MNSSKQWYNIKDEIIYKKATLFIFSYTVHKKLWTLVVFFKSFQNLLGPSAEIRPHQQTTLREIANCVLEMLVIFLTSGGKMLLSVISFFLSGANVTVVIISLVALKQDLLRYCLEWNIEATKYNQSTCSTNYLYATPALLFINVDCTETD